MKKTAEQREKLMVLLLSRDAIEGFLRASLQANVLDQATQMVDEQQYVFLKRICQVLVHLGVSQLGPLWVSGVL